MKRSSVTMGEFAATIGLDWADAKHDICLQAAGTEQREFAVLEHRPESIAAWARALRHTSARKGNGHPHRAGAARARRHSNHTNLYARAHARWNGGEKPPWGRAAILRYLTLMP